jgi:tRNA-dihydrouridine synthase C
MKTFYLAPMEGVMDFVFRDLITSLGGIDQVTTEFVRVTDRLLPDHIFYKYAPELKANSRTRAGTPLYVQLLGGQPGPMAENAARLAELGALGIDLNFGCPAKTVNRHDGGASLLQYPHRIFDIVSSVRKAVPDSVPVTAKIRLGFDSPALCIENAKAAEEGGALRLVVHARTKTDGYKPPAHWHWIPKIQEQIEIPVIANGDIYTSEDLARCEQETGCSHFMIGRGALQNPYIFQELRGLRSATTNRDLDALVLPFYDANAIAVSPHFAECRTKQFLKHRPLLSEEHTRKVPNWREYHESGSKDFRGYLQSVLGVY